MGEAVEAVLASTRHPETDLRSLFALERAPMVRLATLLVGSAPTAEEVVQDAFAQVGARWEALDRPGAYLRTAVVNGCRAVLRRRSIEERARTVMIRPADDEIPTQLIELSDALGALTERQRVVIVLRYFADVPDDEIATVLGCQAATVRSLARRALAVLRAELA